MFLFQVTPQIGYGLKNPGISRSIVNGVMTRLKNECLQSLNDLPTKDKGESIFFNHDSKSYVVIFRC